jgi:prepilin-type N-terminal cleavage/methylation domain-containing protein
MNQTAAKTALQTAQQGFSLIEIAIALALAAVISINYLYNQSQDNEISRAKVQAGYFMTVNDAMGSYMQQYYDQLRVLPGECSLVRLKTGVTPAALPNPNLCRWTDPTPPNNPSPANALQPTLAELRTLGNLDNGFQDSFLWGTDTVVRNSAGNTVNPSYATRIQIACTGNAPITNGTAACASPQLSSLVFNSQPFSATIDDFFKLSRYQLLGAAITNMGGDGLMSLETQSDNKANTSRSQGNLYGVAQKSWTANPIQDGTGRGIPGILAVQNQVRWTCSAH